MGRFATGSHLLFTHRHTHTHTHPYHTPDAYPTCFSALDLLSPVTYLVLGQKKFFLLKELHLVS